MHRIGLRQRIAASCLMLSAVSAALALAEAPADQSTAWAYPIAPAAPIGPRPAEAGPARLPGSDIAFTRAQYTDRFAVPDWQPGLHPPMPPVVASGHRPNVMACGYCHLPTGDGRPENAALAGLPRAYIIAQMAAFRSGARHSSVADRGPQTMMIESAKGSSEADIAAAADYFSKLRHHGFVRVVEAARVPRTRTTAWLYSRDPAGGSEPIGARIIEMPEDFERFEMRDPAMRYTAYVPPGSIARGARLARTWAKGGLACASCHGVQFKGDGDIPPLAGRSPTYIVRQLNDFRTGARSGPEAAPMQQVTATMGNADMIALAAFLGSRAP